MKKNYDDLIKKMLNKKNSSETRGNSPLLTFLDRYSHSNNLLDEICKQIQNEVLLQEAFRQYIVSLVSAFEVYHKDFFKLIFEQCDRNIIYEKCNDLKIDQKLDFIYMLKCYQNNITIEDLLYDYFNFQNLDVLNNVFTTLTGRKIFEEIINLKCKIEKEFYFNLPSNFYEVIRKMVELRHAIIHDIDFSLKIQKSEIVEFKSVLINYVVIFKSWLVDNFISINLKKSRQFGLPYQGLSSQAGLTTLGNNTMQYKL